jgi:hypothetical protein
MKWCSGNGWIVILWMRMMYCVDVNVRNDLRESSP